VKATVEVPMEVEPMEVEPMTVDVSMEENVEAEMVEEVAKEKQLASLSRSGVCVRFVSLHRRLYRLLTLHRPSPMFQEEKEKELRQLSGSGGSARQEFEDGVEQDFRRQQHELIGIYLADLSFNPARAESWYHLGVAWLLLANLETDARPRPRWARPTLHRPATLWEAVPPVPTPVPVTPPAVQGQGYSSTPTPTLRDPSTLSTVTPTNLMPPHAPLLNQRVLPLSSPQSMQPPLTASASASLLQHPAPPTASLPASTAAPASGVVDLVSGMDPTAVVSLLNEASAPAGSTAPPPPAATSVAMVAAPIASTVSTSQSHPITPQPLTPTQYCRAAVHTSGSPRGQPQLRRAGSNEWVAKCPQCPHIQKMDPSLVDGVCKGACEQCGAVLFKDTHAVKGPKHMRQMRAQMQVGCSLTIHTNP
jgi:hypothetical protein